MVSAPCLCAITTTMHTRSKCPPAIPAIVWMSLLGPLVLVFYPLLLWQHGLVLYRGLACLSSQGSFWAETLCPLMWPQGLLTSLLPQSATTLLCTAVPSSLPFQQSPEDHKLPEAFHFPFHCLHCILTNYQKLYQPPSNILTLRSWRNTVPGSWIPANWNHDGELVIAEIPIWCHNLQATLQGRGEEWLLGQGKCVSKN